MITHVELNARLRRSGAKVDAAECHGSLCGVLCVPDGDTGAWLDGVLDGCDMDAVPVIELRDTLQRLAAETTRTLRDGGLGLAPILPKDDVQLGDRTEALGEWCEGFLYGIGIAGLRDYDTLPPDAQEFVRDTVEIARVGAPAMTGEGDEAAYAELVEYLRIGVQLLYERTHPAQAPAVLKAPPGLH